MSAALHLLHRLNFGLGGNGTVRQALVLSLLAEADAPNRIRHIASALGIGKPAVTRALDPLHTSGLIDRRVDPKDGRDRYINITPKGRALIEGAQALERAA